MPAAVDRDAMRMEILTAFQRCIEERPIASVSLRDIAAKANMSHAKLLYYFESRDDIIVSYVRSTRDHLSARCEAWFDTRDPKDYDSRASFLSAFVSYVVMGKAGDQRTSATVQTYVLAHYNAAVARVVHDEYRTWRETLVRCLLGAFGPQMGVREAEAMMAIISGVIICNYNNALSETVRDDIIGALTNLT